MWGNIILSKISGEAKSRISIPAQKDPNIDKIEEELMAYYGNSLKVSELIMVEHKKAGKIPDPSQRKWDTRSIENIAVACRSTGPCRQIPSVNRRRNSRIKHDERSKYSELTQLVAPTGEGRRRRDE